MYVIGYVGFIYMGVFLNSKNFSKTNNIEKHFHTSIFFTIIYSKIASIQFNFFFGGGWH